MLLSRVNTETQQAPTTVDSFSPTLGFQKLFPAKILNCWIDVFRDFTRFVQCTFQTCVRRFHSYQCNLLGSHVLSSLVVMRLNQLLLSHVEAFSVHQLSPNVNSLHTARLQIPTVSVLSPSAIAFESFMECFLAALCQHHPC